MDYILQAFPNYSGASGDMGLTKKEYIATKFMSAMLASPELLKVVTSGEVIGGSAAERCSKIAIEWTEEFLKQLENK